MLSEKVKSIINKYVSLTDNVGVAVSGGSDSMCLLNCIVNEKIIDINRLLVINIEHGIRGEESKRDTSFVEEYCGKNGIKCTIEYADIPALSEQSGRSLETEARIFRKQVFSKLISEGRVNKVLLAHHSGDRTETILMHIFRGSGLQGLIGMSECDGYVIRPLLTTAKAEIMDYIAQNKIAYVTDSTNSDDGFSRNYLRNSILPLIRERWRGIDDSLANLSEIVSLTVNNIGGAENVTLDGDSAILPFDSLNPTAIMKAFSLIGLEADYTRRHIASIVDLANKSSGAGVDIAHNFRAVKEYRGVRIYKKIVSEKPEVPFCVGTLFVGDSAVMVKSCSPLFSRHTTVFDTDKLPKSAVVRGRQAGDRFTPIGGNGKSLSDWLIDKKIPRYEREKLLYVADGNEVYVIIGLATGEKVKIDSDSKNAAEISVMNGEDD